MPSTSIGQFLVENMKRTPPGIKGTPSEMPGIRQPLPGGKGELPPQWNQLLGRERTEPKKGFLPSWAKPIATAAATLPTAIGAWLVGKSGKRLFAEPGKQVEGDYKQRANKIIVDLRGRGYDNEDIQKVLDVLASAYGEESLNVEEYEPY